MNAGGKGAQRQQGENSDARRVSVEIPVNARRQHKFVYDQERGPVQRLRRYQSSRSALSFTLCRPTPTQTSPMIGARISQ